MSVRSVLRDVFNPYTPEPHNRALGMDWYQSQLQAYYNGTPVIPGPRMSMSPSREEPIAIEYGSIVNRAYKRNGIIYACVLARALVFSGARPKFRSLSDRKMYGTSALKPLERPQPNMSTSELLFRMEQDISLAGNWFGTTRFGGIKRLRPDFVSIILGSEMRPEDPGFAEDATVLGYMYQPTNSQKAELFAPQEIAHWSPEPDPDFQFRGMSWVSVVVREVMADNAGTDMRLRFYENNATPNLAITAPEWVKNQPQYDEWKEKLEGTTEGVENAFKTLYLASGTDAKTVGMSMRDVDFKSIQGAGETRLALPSRVPAVLLQNSEGLNGSSLNAGNFSSARRQFGDMFMRPHWMDAFSCMSQLVTVPEGSELWYDESDIPFLREDAGDAAEIQQTKAASIRQHIEAGFTPESAIAAVDAGDVRLLVHTGRVSVQLQEPGAAAPSPPDPSTPEVTQ